MSKDKKQSGVLLHGVFDKASLDVLAKKRPAVVYCPELRPALEGARLMTKELLRRKITPIVIADNMAGFLFYQGCVKEVWIASQLGDRQGALCDIGALIMAVLGKKHKVPVYAYPAGRKARFIGKPREIFYFQGERIAPARIQGYVPLMEWVPGKYITRIMTP